MAMVMTRTTGITTATATDHATFQARAACGSSILTSSTSMLRWRSKLTLMSLGWIFTYFDTTPSSSRCSAGR